MVAAVPTAQESKNFEVEAPDVASTVDRTRLEGKITTWLRELRDDPERIRRMSHDELARLLELLLASTFRRTEAEPTRGENCSAGTE